VAGAGGLGTEVERLRQSGFADSREQDLPLLADLVGRWAGWSPEAPLGQNLQAAILNALEGFRDHPSHLTALQLLCLDPSTTSMTPRDARRLAVARVRGSATPRNTDAFRKKEQPDACRLVADAFLALIKSTAQSQNGGVPGTEAERSRGSSAGERLVLTVLAMDIISDSAEFGQLQERMMRLLAELLREIVGALAPDSTILPTGDGAIIVLEGGTVQEAMDLLGALRRQIDDRLLSLPLRVGVHVGQGLRTVDAHGRASYVGPVLNIAQRIMDLGLDGHILLSRPAAEQLLLSPQSPPAVRPLSANPFRLRQGLELEVFLFYDSTLGRADEPSNPGPTAELLLAQVGRRANWEEMFRPARIIRAIDLSMPILGTPALVDHLERLIRTGTSEVRILLLNPSAASADLRAKSPAYKSIDELATTIEYVIKILRGLRRALEPFGQSALSNFDVRLFDSMPSFSGVLSGDVAYVNIYVDHLSGSRGPYLELIRDSRLGSGSLLGSFEDSFDELWTTSPSLFQAGFPLALEERARASIEWLAQPLSGYLSGDRNGE